MQEAAGALTREYGGTFAKMNLATAEDCSVIHVPAGCYVAQPVHVLYLSLGGAKDEACYSAPRLLVSAEKDSALQLIEEFVPAHDAGGAYVVNAVAEVHVQTGASVDHKVTPGRAVHMRPVPLKVVLSRDRGAPSCPGPRWTALLHPRTCSTWGSMGRTRRTCARRWSCRPSGVTTR